MVFIDSQPNFSNFLNTILEQVFFHMNCMLQLDEQISFLSVLAKQSYFFCFQVGSVGLVYSPFGFYTEVKQRRSRLVLGWVTARVLDREACRTHWTGCQVGQVVSLLGLGTMVTTVNC